MFLRNLARQLLCRAAVTKSLAGDDLGRGCFLALSSFALRSFCGGIFLLFYCRLGLVDRRISFCRQGHGREKRRDTQTNRQSKCGRAKEFEALSRVIHC